MTIFAAARSPTDLLTAAGVPAPSEPVAALLDAMCGAPSTRGRRAIWRTLTAAPWPTSRVTLGAICKGRRGLGTTAAALLVVCDLLRPQLDAHAAPGARLHGLIVCPRLPQAREAAHAARMVLDWLGSLGVRYAARGLGDLAELEITEPRYATHRLLAIRPADDVGARGLAIATAVFDEAGFLPSEEWLTVRDVDIVRAIEPAGLQFGRDRRVLFVSSPGAPGSYFHKLVESPPPAAVVVRAASWILNPRITREQCLELARGDVDVFRQEYEASAFGASGEAFIPADAARACIDSSAERTPKGTRTIRGAVVAVDFASTSDECAFAVAFPVEREITAGHRPVREVVIEHLETWRGTRSAPITAIRAAERAAALSLAFGGVPVVADGRSFVDLSSHLEQRHRFVVIRSGDDEDRLRAIGGGGQVVVERPMGPERQTPRWRLVRDLVLGRRLHVPATPEGEKLVSQLAGLRATQLSSGWLKVEGRRDDLADAVALLAEACTRTPAEDGTGAVLERVVTAARSTREAGWEFQAEWYRIGRDGNMTKVPPPVWSDDALVLAAQSIDAGVWSEQTFALCRQRGLDPRPGLRGAWLLEPSLAPPTFRLDGAASATHDHHQLTVPVRGG